MKVAVLSKADRFGGGASQVAVDLAAALREQSIAVTHYVGWAGKERLRDAYPEHVKPLFGRQPYRMAVKTAMVAQWQLGIPEAFPVEWPSLSTSGILDADIIHVHDITELLSPRSLAWLSHRKPVVWSLHDMSPLTAGCIAPFDGEPMGCTRWREEEQGCDRTCPLREMRGYPFGGRFNGIPLLWREKTRLAQCGKMLLSVPSTWLQDQVFHSALYAGRQALVIPNGIDVDSTFRALPKRDCRSALGISSDKQVLALMAGNLSDANKGFSWAAAALQQLPPSYRNKLQILCIGTCNTVATETLAGFDVTWTGFVQDQRLLAIYLAAADMLLYPSLADNQPLAVIEALACGTPVVAFETGGIPEIIGDEAGIVVEQRDVAAMAAAVTSLLDESDREVRTTAARRRAVSNHSRGRMANDFLALYRNVLASPSHVAGG